MSINLRELLRDPGARFPFSCRLSAERLLFPAVTAFEEPPVGEGTVVNNAGAITVRGHVRAKMRCVCDRCTRPFEKSEEIEVNVPVAVAPEDAENPDYFVPEGDLLDIDDLLETAFILEADMQFLCRDDCKGLCPRCGADLNEGPCACKKESDPRLAVLEQLLDDKDQTN